MRILRIFLGEGGIVATGDEDVNYTGVVGSTRDDDSPPPRSRSGRAHTGVSHHGKGKVNINGQSYDAGDEPEHIPFW